MQYNCTKEYGVLMKPDKFFIYGCLLLAFLFALSSCKPVNIPIQVPTATLASTIAPANTAVPTLSPTSTPLTAQMITSTNAGLLKAIGEVKIQQPMRLVWAKNSQTFWVVNDFNATRYNSQTLDIEFPFNAVSPGRILDASADGNSITYDADNQGTIRILDQNLNKTLAINPGSLYENVTFSPDGTLLAVTYIDKLQVAIWDTATGSKIRTLKGFQTAAPVYEALIGSDNKTLIWHSRGTIQLQDIISQKMSPVFSHEDFVMGFALTNDGNILASAAGGTINGNYTPVIFIWNARNGNNLAKLPYPDSFSTLTFSPDRAMLASASAGNLILWDMTTFKVINIIQVHSNAISDITFSPDGKSLLTSSAEDNLVKLWQVLQ
jgi:WD40 repeat protein